LDSANKQLQIKCPGSWRSAPSDEITILPGESGELFVAVNSQGWKADPYEGVSLDNKINVHVQCLNQDGEPLMDTLVFELAFGYDRYPAIKRIQAAF